MNAASEKDLPVRWRRHLPRDKADTLLLMGAQVIAEYEQVGKNGGPTEPKPLITPQAN